MLQSYPKVSTKIGRLNITILSHIIQKSGRHRNSILLRIKPVLQCFIGYGPLITILMTFSTRLKTCTRKIKCISTIHFRINGCKFNIINHSHDHSHSNS